ncbi:probable G-protein coupled receptor 160 [Pleuronectes platessa]|uniref:probable G-protein coupled receptor 160 n=1 Tax=Pleuronectes platessa TaxID=8262 RepID=UPI00232A2DFA|nr:probable G-protein coupled receptor 160 [Pleuronectes platessa]
MLPDIPVFLETGSSIKMLAILEKWNDTSGFHIDNTVKCLSLMLSKFGMDTMVFLLCSGKLYTSFLNMCSLSIILGDMTMVLYVTAVWLLGPESSPVSLCYFLAHASAVFKALPLPMIAMGITDYCIEDTHHASKSSLCKFLRNLVLTLLVWTLAVIYSVASTKVELMELVYMTGIKALACEVKVSTFINFFILGLFSAVILMILPFSTKIPMWVREADRLSKSREEQDNQRSDLFTSTSSTETKSSKENDVGENNWLRPPLGHSLTLGFALIWMPYLTVCVACLAFDFTVPAYISVNVFWLECTNSLLVGVLFWVKSKSLGPYSNLPENVCAWHVFWNLSKGTWQQQLPTAVFNPSEEKRNPLFYI